MINIDLSKYETPKIYRRKNKDCYFDPIREKLIQITPEETVRQKIIQFLIKEMKVPVNLIEIEVPLCHFSKEAKGRADIVVYAKDKKSNPSPVMIVECKSQTSSLTHSVYKQVIGYDSILETGVIAITNGLEMHFRGYHAEQDTYLNFKSIPRYSDLVNNRHLELDYSIEELPERPRYKELFDKEMIQDFEYDGIIGEDTRDNLKPFILNLCTCLFDEKTKFPLGNYNGIKVIKDCGLREASYGNAAGGSFPGIYRYFIIEDEKGNNQIVSFSIMAIAKVIDDPVYGNRKGKSVLIVSIDDFDKSHNSLELSIDDFVLQCDSIFKIWHNGRLTVGNKGSAKISEFLAYMKQESPDLVDSQGKVFLGELDNSKLLLLNDDKMVCFLGRLIRYAIVRDGYREVVKRRSK